MDVCEFPSSEAEFRGRFADEDHCREYLARLKWPEGVRCAHCSGDRAYFLPSKRVVYECAGCGRQISVIAGTIFEQSKKPLVLWFRALFEITASKQGISAAELQRKLGLGSYQTAWSWLTKIRTAMVRPNREPLSGEVEIDESYVGGPEPGKPGRAAEDKAIVAAAVEKRGKSCGRVRLGVIATVSADVPPRLRRQPPRRWRNRSHRRLARLCPARQHRLSPHHLGVVQARSDRGRGTAPRSSDLLAAQAMDPRHPSAVGEPQTSRRLPRGVYLPLVWGSWCQAPNVDAVLLPVPTSRRRRAGGSVHDGLRGARHRARIIAPQACIRSIGVNPDHDAAMRISGEAPGCRATRQTDPLAT